MEQKTKYQTQTIEECITISAMRPVREIASKQVGQWSQECQGLQMIDFYLKVTSDLEKLLENTRSQAYVKGYKAGYSHQKEHATNGNYQD